MEEARKTLEAALGRPPAPQEMADKLGIPVEEFYKQLGDATAVSQVSLNKKVVRDRQLQGRARDRHPRGQRRPRIPPTASRTAT